MPNQHDTTQVLTEKVQYIIDHCAVGGFGCYIPPSRGNGFFRSHNSNKAQIKCSFQGKKVPCSRLVVRSCILDYFPTVMHRCGNTNCCNKRHMVGAFFKLNPEKVKKKLKERQKRIQRFRQKIKLAKRQLKNK
jgi:hypothetical protein